MNRLSQGIVVDIGTSQIKVAYLQSYGLGFTIKKLLIENVSKIDKDKLIEKAKEVLKNSFSRYELQGASILFILSYPLVEIKRLELPNMPGEEIRNAITWQAKDKTAINIEECYFDFARVAETTEEDGTKKIVVLVATSPKAVINKIVDITKELDVEIAGVNACQFSFADILKGYSGADKEEAQSVVEIGSEHTYISLYKDNILFFLRIVPTAARHIINAVKGEYVVSESPPLGGDAFMDSSGSAQKKVELTEEQAESYVRKYGIPFDRNEEFLEGGIPTRQVLARMRPVLENLSNEIKRTFEYSTSELGGAESKKVFLAGGSAQIKNMEVFLRENLKMDVEILRLPENIKNETGITDIAPFLGVISRALGDVGERPDLLPIEFRKRKLKQIEKSSIRMIAFTAFSILILSYLILSLRVADYRNRLKSAASHKAVIQKLSDTYEKVLSGKEFINKVSASSFSYVNIFKEISNITPENIMLEELSIDGQDKSLKLKGRLYHRVMAAEEVLTSYMQRIERSALFKEANLIRIEKEKREIQPYSNFDIECKIN